MAELQARMLAHAATLVRPGGLLIYSTCSLQPEEGEHHIAAFLATHPDFQPAPIAPTEIGADPTWITPDGDPAHAALPPPPGSPPDLSGIDGFYVSRLRRSE